MKPIKIQVDPGGVVRALWDEHIDWSTIGRMSVSRASHVEFCNRRQAWYVRAATPRNTLRKFLQAALQRPFGEILYWATTRDEALTWECAHFGVGGPGWR
jgi:hypothetical protein